MKLFSKTLRSIYKKTKNETNTASEELVSPENTQLHLFTSLEENMSHIKKVLGNSSDIVIRPFKIGPHNEYKLSLVYTVGLVDSGQLQDLLETLMYRFKPNDLDKSETGQPASFIDSLKEKSVTVGEVDEVNNFPSLMGGVLSGKTIILVEGQSKGISVSIKGFEKRGVEEPQSATLIKGPRDGFNETLATNIALIRRRIRSSNLWFESMEIGRVTKTDVVIAYINGIANEDIIKEVQKRLKRIDIDGILESGYIEELIQDETYTPFPTVYSTERPDSVAAKLLEGRIAIFVDGTPFVMVVPSLFIEFFQASEDYYQRADIATLLRVLRFFCFFIALLAPAFYISILTFHQEMLPTHLLIGIAAQREGVPFPAFIEALMMEVSFEVLREAGVRMPRAVGQAMSIVGALVLGQAAVQAGIVSPVMVIVVAITAVANFCFPSINMAISIRIIRFVMMSLAAAFGFFGVMFGLIILVIHLSGLRSFGVPYTAPVAPFILQEQKDVFVRVPWWGMFSRPRLISRKNVIREQNNPTPKTESRKGDNT
ncbi:spore germination protein [Alkalihalobacillus sp. 1P02AB]|uniref:spore germination protein n=1 Tax=Alkalihalobacillus sp. 1P02AB TaxID=3132260 RepID=UPI0039A5F006